MTKKIAGEKGMSKKKLSGIVLVVSMSMIAVFVIVYGSSGKQSGPSSSAQRIKASVQQTLQAAEIENNRALEQCLGEIRNFFAQGKKGAALFAGDVLGSRSKWYWVTDEKQFHIYSQERFDQRIFSPEALQEKMEKAVQEYLQSLDNIDQIVWGRLRLDLHDLPQTTIRQWKSLYEEALHQARKTAEPYVGLDVVKTTSSAAAGVAAEVIAQKIVGYVIRKTLPRLGVSSTILGAGAATSGISVGVSIGVSIAVDAIISWIWDWLADPQGELAKQIEQKLDEMCNLLLEGDESNDGLRKILQKSGQERNQLRQKILVGQ